MPSRTTKTNRPPNKEPKKNTDAVKPNNSFFIYTLIGIESAADSVYLVGTAFIIPIFIGITITATPLLIIATLLGLGLATGLIFTFKCYDEY
ncbi:MAG: hypothetical protein K2Q14_06290, partial [Gammaproteobacteria bacterium]|nr:hypothetical protein [Gammaproteobacteria bacterium]